MSKFDFPNSDRRLLAFIGRTLQTQQTDAGNGVQYVSPETIVKASGLLPRLEAALHDVDLKLDNRVNKTAVSSAAVDKLRFYVVDSYDGLRRQVRREAEPESKLRYYGLAADGINPSLTRREEVISHAKLIIQGDADAVAAGLRPLSNPTAQETAVQLALTQQALAETIAADRALDEAQTALALLREEARKVVEDILADIRYFGRHLTASSLRRVIRAYGGSYSLEPGETPDPEEGASEESHAG